LLRTATGWLSLMAFLSIPVVAYLGKGSCNVFAVHREFTPVCVGPWPTPGWTRPALVAAPLVGLTLAGLYIWLVAGDR
jgi:hypothetical protein